MIKIQVLAKKRALSPPSDDFYIEIERIFKYLLTIDDSIDKKLRDIKQKLMNDLIWKVTEYNGKYIGQRYWSYKAIEFYKTGSPKHFKVKNGNKKKTTLNLEHFHPIDEIREKFKSASSKIPEIIRGLKVCVILNSEHDILPLGGWRWERYRNSNIIIVDLVDKCQVTIDDLIKFDNIANILRSTKFS
jgi:hypothetical protein